MENLQPALLDWSLLIGLATWAGVLNALKCTSGCKRKTDWLLMLLAASTANFAAITTFLILSSLLPDLFGIHLKPAALAAASAIVAWLGFAETLKLAKSVAGR